MSHSQSTLKKNASVISNWCYLHGLAFRHDEMDNTRSREEKRHAHLHHLDFSIRRIGFHMGPVWDQESEKFARRLS
jgi:hypothetical protein